MTALAVCLIIIQKFRVRFERVRSRPKKTSSASIAGVVWQSACLDFHIIKLQRPLPLAVRHTLRHLLGSLPHLTFWSALLLLLRQGFGYVYHARCHHHFQFASVAPGNGHREISRVAARGKRQAAGGRRVSSEAQRGPTTLTLNF